MTRPGIRLRAQHRSFSRRSGTIPGRRFALAVGLAFAALGSSASSAPADAGSQPIVSATIYSSSGTSPDSVTLGALQQNVQCPQYSGQSMQELGRQGFVDVVLPPAGSQTGTWLLSTILGCLQTPVPVSAVSGVTVLNSEGSPQEGAGSQITRADLSSPSDFSNGGEGPVIEDRGSVIQYDRPWRGSQSDEDFLDEVQGSENGQPAPIAIDVFEGPTLSVTLTASETSVPAGTTVSFQATVSPPGQSGLSYSWNFDGGATNSRQPAPQATFDTAGQYDVTVQVTDAAGGGGGASIPITVGAAPPAASGSHNQSGAGKSRKSHTPTGPLRSGGSHPGAHAGNSHGDQSSTTGKGHGSGSPTANGHRSGSATRTTPSPAGTTTRPSSSGGAAAGVSSSEHQAPPSPTRTAAAPARTPPHPSSPLTTKPPTAAPTTGPVVAGRLIADVFPLSGAASPLVRSVPAPVSAAPPARQAVRASVLPALAGSLAVVFLFILGVGRELRWRVPRLRK